MSRLWNLLAAMTIATGAAVSVGTPAQAATSCYWLPGQWGNASNCDNLSPNNTSCLFDRFVARSANIGPGIDVELWYSPSCRTVYASMWADIELGPGSNCYMKVTRNSDGETLRAGVTLHDRPHRYAGYTNMLYDADVTSYAWGYCKTSTNGPVYRGGTSSY